MKSTRTRNIALVGILSGLCALSTLTGCPEKDNQNPDGGQLGPTPTCTDRPASLEAFDVDVPTITLTGKITVGGATPMSQAGSVLLVNRTIGDSMLLGRTGDPSYAAKQIVPGTYDIVYQGSSQAGADIPANTRAVLRSGVELKATAMLDVDIPVVSLSGKITVNGLKTNSQAGSVALRGSDGDAALLGRTGDGTYGPRLVVPGRYDIVYSYGNGQGTIDVPRNTLARLKQGVDVKQSAALDVDIPAVTISGKLTVNGQVPMSRSGALSLRSGEDTAFLGTTGDPTGYAARLVIPGSYDVVYSLIQGVAGMTDVPRNTAAKVRSADVKQSGPLDIDVPAVALSGKITVNGQAAQSNAGTVTLREPAGGSGDVAYLGRTGDPSYGPQLVVPGKYDLTYAYNSTGQPNIDVPRNSQARFRSVEVRQTAALDVDIPAVSVSGKLTVNGAATQSTAGIVLLRNRTTGDAAQLARTGEPTYAARLIVRGTYDVYYSFNAAGAQDPIDIPRNTSSRLRQGVEVTGPLDIDIPAVGVQGKITVGGLTPMSRSGAVTLGNPEQGDSLLLGRTGDATYVRKLVVPAPYNLVYGYGAGNDPVIDIPRNSAALLGCKRLATQ